jgi:Swiss Army Knife RNA repair-like protein
MNAWLSVAMLTGLPGPTLYVPPPRRTGGRVLFLDLDGCLHPDAVYEKRGSGPFLYGYPDHRLFEYAALLEEVLAPHPKVRVVLSTSWVRRYRGSIARVTRGLTPALRARVVGRTYHSRMDQAEFASAPRGMQIWREVLRRKPEAWLAVDDDWLHCVSRAT